MLNLKNLIKRKEEQKKERIPEFFKKQSIKKQLKKIDKIELEEKKPQGLNIEKPSFNAFPKAIFKIIFDLFVFIKRKLKRINVQERKHHLRSYIERAGIEISPKTISKRLFTLCVFVNLAISFYLIYYFSVNFGFTWSKILTAIFSLWIFVFIILLFAIWVIFYIGLDLKIFKKNLDIEDVLPDFLQLTASNIKAGMTIDRALWYAVRPRFGVLAKEIEQVAKETMSGKDLKDALQDFAVKYNSQILKRSINLLIEGIEAGGEIGNLLIRVASNIQETKIMKQEMAANVTTYTLFISFATVIAAPFLFTLSGILIQVLQSLSSSLSTLGTTTVNVGLALSFKGTGINYNDFRIFVIITLIITSFFSSCIVAIIKKGEIRAGFKYIPIFIISSITMYFIAQLILNNLFSIFF